MTQRSTPRLSRRVVLRSLGGATLALPLLEGLGPRSARADAPQTEPYAVFFRQADGVACAQTDIEIGYESEKFWPREIGALTEESVADRAVGELSGHLNRLLMVRGVNMRDYDFGDGHARGALQVLTGCGPYEPAMSGDSEAGGESVDHRIGREMNAEGVESLVLYAGMVGGWLGGPCISHRGAAQRRSAEKSPWNAYLTMVGLTKPPTAAELDLIQSRGKSVNDLVRDQLKTLLTRTDLSQKDRERLDLHLSSIRDFELTTTCRAAEDAERVLQGVEPSVGSSDGNLVLEVARAHMDVAALAIACGYTRSVSIQVGDGNDGVTRYWDGDVQMENYHYISHRRLSHDASGEVIPGSDLLHHKIDLQFAQTFRHLLDRLAAYDLGDRTLLDAGAAIWLNDLGNGPAHSPWGIPWIIAGSAGSYFKQGECIDLDDKYSDASHVRLLNAVATAVGCRTEGLDYCADVGDPELDRTPHPGVKA